MEERVKSILGSGKMLDTNISRFIDFLKQIPSFEYHFNPFPDDKILDRSKLKQIADDILKCV